MPIGRRARLRRNFGLTTYKLRKLSTIISGSPIGILPQVAGLLLLRHLLDDQAVADRSLCPREPFLVTFRMTDEHDDDDDLSGDDTGDDDAKAKKRKERLEQNRISARESRKRKKTMIEELQRTVITLSRENKELNERNENLRRQLMEIGAKVCVSFSNWVCLVTTFSITRHNGSWSLGS